METDVFRIVDNAIAPKKAHFERAVKRLPVAHRIAQHAGITHLHQQVTQAVEEAGLDSSPIVIGWKKNQAPYIGIQYGEQGDRLADVEYGTPDDAPNPILRTAARANHPSANVVYGTVLKNELGF